MLSAKKAAICPGGDELTTLGKCNLTEVQSQHMITFVPMK